MLRDFRCVKESKTTAVALTLYSHNLLTDRAGELFKPFKEAESLLSSIFKNSRTWGLNFFWCGDATGGHTTESRPEKEVQVTIHLFFLKQTRQKSASLEPLIGFLELVLFKFWPSNGVFAKFQIFTLCQ